MENSIKTGKEITIMEEGGKLYFNHLVEHKSLYLLDDNLLKINKGTEDPYHTYSFEYEFKTPLIVGFIIDEKQKTKITIYINNEPSYESEDISPDNISIIKSEKQIVHNGSYYKLEIAGREENKEARKAFSFVDPK